MDGKNYPKLWDIVGAFKSIVIHKYIQYIKNNNLHAIDACIWQKRFYDEIIRDKIALNAIRDYICKNPAKWERDRNNLGKTPGNPLWVSRCKGFPV